MVGVRIGRDLFGRHVGRRAERDAERCQRRGAAGIAHGLRDAEIGDHRVVPEDQHIVGLDVAMHDAARMRVRERVRDITQNAHCLVRGEFAVPRQPRAQRLALHERHRVVEQVARLAGRMHGHDVRMLQRCDELNLAAEAVDVHRCRHFRRQHLDHDLTAERRFLRHEHVRHPAAAKLALDPIAVAERGLQPFGEVLHHECSALRRATRCFTSLRSAAAPDPRSSTDRSASHSTRVRACDHPSPHTARPVFDSSPPDNSHR